MADLDLTSLPSYAKIGVNGAGSDDTSSASDNCVVRYTNGPGQKPYKVAIRQQPVTELRKPYVPKEGDALKDSGTARANIAASKESPNGTTEADYAGRHQNQTVCFDCDCWSAFPLTTTSRSSFNMQNTGTQTTMA